MRFLFLLALGAATSGCGIFSSTMDGSQLGDAALGDGAQGGGGDGGLNDLTVGPDMANVTVTVHWSLIGQNIQGGLENGFPMNCDDPMLMATSLTIVAKNDAGLTSMQSLPCPAGESTGMIELAPPDLVGPYTITGSVDGKPKSASERVHNVTLMSGASLAIYALGCDMPGCLM